jgi:hypothetical protein
MEGTMAWLPMVNRSADKILVNTDSIIRIEPDGSRGSKIVAGSAGSEFYVTETVDVILKRLTAIGEKIA